MIIGGNLDMNTFKDYGWFIGLVSGVLLTIFNSYFWCELIMSIEITFGSLYLITVLTNFFANKYTKLTTGFKRAIFVIGIAMLFNLMIFFNNWWFSFILIPYVGLGLLDVIFEDKFLKGVK